MMPKDPGERVAHRVNRGMTGRVSYRRVARRVSAVPTGPMTARTVPAASMTSGTPVSPAAPWSSGAGAGRGDRQKRHNNDGRDASHGIHNRQTIRCC